jgi:hypothetical protein
MTDGERQLESVKSDDQPRKAANVSTAQRADNAKSNPPATAGEFLQVWWRGVAGEFTPPNLWTHSRPPLRESWLYAAYGKQAAEFGAGRQMSRAAAWIAIPLRALALWLDWCAERPSRFCVAAILYFVTAQFLPISPNWLVL